MTIAICLFAYGALVAVVAPRLLTRFRHADRAPGAGVAVWVTAMASVLFSWVGAAGLLLTDVAASAEIRHVLARCAASFCAAALGAHGTTWQWTALGTALVGTAGLGGVLVVTGGVLLRARRHTHRHAESARLLGVRDERWNTVVVDVPYKIAYAVAGRPSAIVLSRAAVEALDAGQLRAVLAHERAHLTGRHHLLLAVSRALTTAMPGLLLFRRGASEVGRLLEMCADDSALRHHDARDLLGALVALSGQRGVPVNALGVAGSAVADRAERIAAPPGTAAVYIARLALLSGALTFLAISASALTVACDFIGTGM